MNELFTFNSQQFRMMVPAPSTSRSIRKRIISNSGIRRVSSLRSDSTTCQHQKSNLGLKSGYKMVQFDLVPFSRLQKHPSQVDNFLEENLLKLQKIVQSKSNRYCNLTDNKKSLQLERKSCFEEKIQQNKGNSSMDAENFHRKQKRIKSLRLGPKIIIPLSDRKLPKAFKMIKNPTYLPNIISEKQGKRKQLEMRQIRETFSSQKARVLLNYGDHLSQMFKKQSFGDKEQNLPQEI